MAWPMPGPLFDGSQLRPAPVPGPDDPEKYTGRRLRREAGSRYAPPVRVLVTTTPGRGHYHPMLPLAQAIADRGHDLLWVASAEVCERLRGQGFEAHAAGLAEGVTSADMIERFPELLTMAESERPNFAFSKIFGTPSAAPMLEELLPVAREWNPDLLVCEQLELAGPIAAALLGVPNVTHGLGHPLPEMLLACVGEEMTALWREQGLQVPDHAGTYEHLYLDIYPDPLKTFPSPHIASSFPVRPYAPGPAAKDPSRRPLVYVTFGTVFNKDLTTIGTVVEGVRQLDVDVLVTLGPGADPATLGAQPHNVDVRDYVPQEETLARAAAVVSHAGSGTFLAALAHGLPQLTVPQNADQFLNSHAGAKAGVAREIAPGEVTAARVRAELETLLGDATIAGAARRMAHEIAAMPGPDEVAQELERRYG
jgi:UDP:flavonoid glycosyltransferase YjiC (YdhE family)